jgi:hypothetical protein
MKIKTIVFPLIGSENINGHIFDYENMKECYTEFNTKPTHYLLTEPPESRTYSMGDMTKIVGTHSKVYEEDGSFYVDLELFEDYKELKLLDVENLDLSSFENCLVVSSAKYGFVKNNKAKIENVVALYIDNFENVCPHEFRRNLKIKRIVKIANNI